MPQPRSTSRGTLTRLVLFAVLGWALYALRRGGAEDTKERALEHRRPVTEAAPAHEPTRARARARSRGRRFATSLAFATLFFAGAALSAGAGDALVEAIESETQAAQACPAEPTDAEATADPACAADEPVPAEGEAAGETAGDETTEPAAETATETEPMDGAGSADPAGDESAAGDEAATDASESAGDGEAAEDAQEASGDAGEASEGSDGAAEDAADPPAPADDKGNGAAASDAPAPAAPPAPPVLAPHDHTHDETAELDPEAEAPGAFATVWLHRALPDPTPPARRLKPAFARQLRAAANRAGVDWAMLLGVVRADGYGGRQPVTAQKLRAYARQIAAVRRAAADDWHALLAFRGRTAFADRALALTRYNRAVGLRALVTGLEAARARLADHALADPRLDIYGGGRADIAAGRIDVRVLVLMRYLAEAYGQVTISSLQTGHRLYSRPGVVSAHVYGLAVDIAALGGAPIAGNSAPGGLTDQAVRDILLLPAELRPRQVISLLGLGGPSFPMADHYDHIHVGF